MDILGRSWSNAWRNSTVNRRVVPGGAELSILDESMKDLDPQANQGVVCELVNSTPHEATTIFLIIAPDRRHRLVERIDQICETYHFESPPKRDKVKVCPLKSNLHPELAILLDNLPNT